MKHSESFSTIIGALIKAQGEVTNPEKTKTANGKTFSYKYADLPEVLDCVKPVLSKHGIAVFQTTLGDDASKILLITTLMHSSGEWISTELPVDVSQLSPQEIGAELTYFRRYSLCGLLNIHGDEDTDAAGIDRPKKPAQPTVKQPSQPSRVVTASAKQPVETANGSEFKAIAQRAVERAANTKTNKPGIKEMSTDELIQWRAISFENAKNNPKIYDAVMQAEDELFHNRGINISNSIKSFDRPLGVTQ